MKTKRPLYMWKFIIKADEWKPLPGADGVEVSGTLAVAIAHDEAGARRAIDKYAAENGNDARWVQVARVVRIPLRAGAVGAFVMT